MTLDTTPEDAREAVATLLAGKDVFSGIPVLTHKSADLSSLLDEIQAKVGVRIVVILISAKELNPQSVATEWEIDFCVDVGEYVPLNQTANGTRKGAWALAWTVVSALKIAKLPLGGQEIFPQPHPDLPMRELHTEERWDANLLIVRAYFRLTVSGIPRPTSD